MTASAIELANVRRVYRGRGARAQRVAVDGVSLSIERGAWVALLGPNGSGKTTLLRLIATLDEPDDGRVTWFADSSAARASVRGRIGVVFQSPSLDALLSVRENLRVHAAVFGMDARTRETRIDALAGELDLADRLDDLVGALSGGLARRADLARAMLPAPDLLLLDEPTAGLDPPSREGFLGAVASRRESTSMTVLMTTHLMDEAERTDRVVMMHLGRVVADGSPGELRRSIGEDGRLVLRAAWNAHELLESLGLSPRRAGAEALAPVADEAALSRAVESLATQGVPAVIGPPTLGDVFASCTGEELEATQTAEAAA